MNKIYVTRSLEYPNLILCKEKEFIGSDLFDTITIKLKKIIYLFNTVWAEPILFEDEKDKETGSVKTKESVCGPVCISLHSGFVLNYFPDIHAKISLHEIREDQATFVIRTPKNLERPISVHRGEMQRLFTPEDNRKPAVLVETQKEKDCG